VLQSRSCDQFSDVLLSRPAAAAQLLDRTHELKERDKSTPRPCGQHAGRKPAPLFPSSPSPACHRRSPPRSEWKSVACCCKSSPSSEVSPSKPWKGAGRFEPRKLGECLLVDRTPHTLEPSSFCRVNQNKDKCLCLITLFLPYTGI